jgi:hypothetical protein
MLFWPPPNKVCDMPSVLKCESTIRENIAIMRTFVQLFLFMMGSMGVVSPLTLTKKNQKQIGLSLRLRSFSRKSTVYFKTTYCVFALPHLTMYIPRLKPALVMMLRSSPICSAWNSPINAPSGLNTLYVL